MTTINNKYFINPYKKLVFAGGGFRGLAYIGAVKALRQLNILQGIDEVLGCSIGGILALLIVLDYSDSELLDFLLHFNYDDLREMNFFKIIDTWGIESGSKIEKFLTVLIHRKTGLLNPTFAQLSKKCSKKLIVNAVAVDSFKQCFFSATLTPDVKVVKAIRASISIPGFFSPVKLQGHILVDGALLDNFPLDFFREHRWMTLGIKFNEKLLPCGQGSLVTVQQYFTSVFSCMYKRMQDLKGELLSESLYDIISIPTGTVSTLQSSLDRTTRLFLFHHGEQSVLNFFSLKNPNKNYPTTTTQHHDQHTQTHHKVNNRVRGRRRRNSI